MYFSKHVHLLITDSNYRTCNEVHYFMIINIKLQYNFPILPIAPAESMQPLCMPALMVLVRGGSGLAAAAVLCMWPPVPHFGGFGLEFSYLK